MKIIGNIGKNPETRTTQGGRQFISFSVAESWGKEDNRTTNWFGVSFFGKPEDMEGFRAGSRVEVEGDLKTPRVVDGRIYLDLMSSKIKAAPLPPKKDSTGAPAPAGQSNPAPAPAAAPGAGVPDQYEIPDDDIPF